MLSVRLEKLEKDLHLLSAMQELLLTTSSSLDTNTRNGETGVPEREVNNQRMNPKTKLKKCNLNLNSEQSNSKCTSINLLNKTKSSKPIEQNERQFENYEDENQEHLQKVSELESEVNRIHEQLQAERAKRDEVEDAGRRVALQLQKVCDFQMR